LTEVFNRAVFDFPVVLQMGFSKPEPVICLGA